MEKRTLEAWESPEIMKAFEELEKMSRDPSKKALYEARFKFLTDMNSLRYDSYTEGREEGLKDGREEEKRTIALTMHANGFPLKQIATLVGVDEELVARWIAESEQTST